MQFCTLVQFRQLPLTHSKNSESNKQNHDLYEIKASKTRLYFEKVPELLKETRKDRNFLKSKLQLAIHGVKRVTFFSGLL